MHKPLYVAFLWHMHQPYYKDTVSEQTAMPWVRLHAVKDYLDMAQILEDFPTLHQTFNVVPSLLEQLEDLLRPDSKKDKPFELSLKKVAELSEEDKAFLLKNFFMVNWETMIKPFPRYHDLLVKRGRHMSPEMIPKTVTRFTAQDYLDLQVLFNLVWIDPHLREKEAGLKELVKKGRYYSEEDKKLVLDKHLEIAGQIIPLYKKMQEEGLIEVSVSPFYHPILPLLCDWEIAKTSYPEIRLPNASFRHPEDARAQIGSALACYTEKFGRPPQGMWPSEGSVSEEVIDLAIEAGLKWLATDEEILFKSLNNNAKTHNDLYKPYYMQRQGGELSLIFRDKKLSDSIGFVYQSWPAEKAAADLLNNLYGIREALPKINTPHLVAIILDGENAWEYYPNDGRNFLLSLYKSLNNNPAIKLVTISEFLKEHPAQDKIERLFPGSWINGNFNIWIGHEEKNKALEYLKEVRDTLEACQKARGDSADENLKKAWKELYIAEGSDWNWWFGDDHSSANDEEFDKLFRTHIANIYKLAGQKPPEGLSIPIKSKKAKIIREPSALIRPRIDGIDSNYFEWINAGLIDTGKLGGTMHQADTIIRRFYFGFDMDSLYFRFDLKLSEEDTTNNNLKLNLLLLEKKTKITIPILKNHKEIEYVIFEKKEKDQWIEIKKEKAASFYKILEAAVKFEDAKVKNAETIRILVNIERDGLIIEHCPEYGSVQIALPSTDYESEIWTA